MGTARVLITVAGPAIAVAALTALWFDMRAVMGVGAPAR
jgi:hypothetical protein